MITDRAQSNGSRGEPVVAYLYLRQDSGTHTRAVLEEHVHAFAAREGYDLASVIVAAEGSRAGEAVGDGPRLGADVLDEVAALRELVQQIETTCARMVLVVGPARQALVLLHRMSGIQVLTLAHVRPLNLHRTGVRPGLHQERRPRS